MKERAIYRERAVVAHNQAAEVSEPGVGAFDDPATPVPPQRSAILRRRFLAVGAMRRDQFDSAPCQPLAQRIAVVGFVGDHPHRFLPRTPCTMTPTYADRRERRFRAPDFHPDALLLPVPQPPPAGRGMRILLGQVLPASTAPQNPQNPFQDTAVVDPRAATTAILARFREQGRDFLPLRFGQQRTRPRHRPSLGAADSPYRSFRKTQPSFFQTLVLGYATASRHSRR